MATGYMVSFLYTNHRGEFSRRTVEVEALEYLREPSFGHAPGWFLSGTCQDKKAWRSFALANIYIPQSKGANRKLIEIAVAQGEER